MNKLKKNVKPIKKRQNRLKTHMKYAKKNQIMMNVIQTNNK